MLMKYKRDILLITSLLLVACGVFLLSPSENIKASSHYVVNNTYNKRNNHKPHIINKPQTNNQNNRQNNNQKNVPHPVNRNRNSRFLHYRFVTQTGRGNANDGCEAASLLMALQHYGLAKHQNLKHFVNRIPRSWNPERGYTGNPFVFGTGASLYPNALLRVAKRYGAKKSYIIDDYYGYGRRLYRRKASANSFIRAILKGYPVVFEGGNRMQYGGHTYRRGYRGYASDHVLMLYGYKNHRFYWTDPDHRRDRRGSTRVRLFMYIINAPVRGPRAVAIAK